MRWTCWAGLGLLLAGGCSEEPVEASPGGSGGSGGSGGAGPGELGACEASSNRFNVLLTSSLDPFACGGERSAISLEGVLLSAERREATKEEDDAVVFELSACEAEAAACVPSLFTLTVVSPGVTAAPPQGTRLRVDFVSRPYVHVGSEGCKEGLVVRVLPDLPGSGGADAGLWLAGNVDLFEGDEAAPLEASFVPSEDCAGSSCRQGYELRLAAGGGDPLALAQGEAGTFRPGEGSGIALASGYVVRNLASYGEADQDGEACVIVSEFWLQRPAP